MRNKLHKLDLHRKRARGKPFLSTKNQNHSVKRDLGGLIVQSFDSAQCGTQTTLMLAHDYLAKTRNNVLWTHKAKILNFSIRRHACWKLKVEFRPKNLRSTLKHGGGHLMIWHCFAHQGSSPSQKETNMNSGSRSHWKAARRFETAPQISLSWKNSAWVVGKNYPQWISEIGDLL